MKSITTTIKREYLREIVAGRKREINPCWIAKLAAVRVPFKLRLINGMSLSALEATVVVRRVRRHSRTGEFESELGPVLEVRNLDRRREQPIRRR
jgi:hypothetical protein